MIPRILLTVALGVTVVRAEASALDYQCSPGPQHLLSPQAPLCPQQDSDSPPKSEQYDHPFWSHSPFCVSGKLRKYCTHTTANFRNNYGLSIIANPKAAMAATQLFDAARKAPYYPQEGLEVRDIPGKGKGLIATRPIKKGDIIMLDSPRIIASAQFPQYVMQSEGQALFNQAVKRLPDADREMVLNLGKSMGGTDIEDVMKTNSFACQINDGGVGDGYMCLFPSVARINHACRPNAHARFTPATMLMDIRAFRDIAPGEEISISYGRLGLQHSERQSLYKKGWGFTCTCELCTASDYEIAGSDQRRTRFAQLREKLNAVTSENFDAQQIVAWETEVLEISTKEGFDVLVAEDYERLAYVYSSFGMREEARTWAQRAKETLMQWDYVEGGPDNDIRRVNELLRELGV